MRTFILLLIFCLGCSSPTEDQVRDIKIELLKQRIEVLSNNSILINTTKRARVTVTAYHPVTWQTDNTPRTLANGDYVPNVEKAVPTVALSRDLKASIEFGSWIYLKHIPRHCGTSVSGWYQVRDVMHHRWRRRVDILLPISEPVFKETDVELYIANDPQRLQEQLHQLGTLTQKQC